MRFGPEFYEIGAELYGNPEYLWMAHFIRTASPSAPPKVPVEGADSGWWPYSFPPHQPQRLAGRRWWPLAFPPRQPKNFVGLHWAEPDEMLFSLARPAWAKENGLTAADCFGRAAFRAGIRPEDDYLLLDGVHLGHAYDDQNGILEYSTLGRTFLVSLDYNYGTKASAHNVVSVSVDGFADAAPSPLAVRRLWADLPAFAATRTVLLTDGGAESRPFHHPSADWERNILWLKNRFFVVFDRVIARRDGLHSAVGFWRTVGQRRDLPGGIEVEQGTSQGNVRFRLQVQGADRCVVGKEEDPQAAYLFTRYDPLPPPLDNVPPVIHVLKAHKARRLKAGESFTMATCFWAASPQRPQEVGCTAVADNAIRVDLDQDAMLAATGPVALAGLATDAELSLIASDRLCLVAARKLSVGGRAVLDAESPISLQWDLASGQCEVVCRTDTKAVMVNREMTLPAGRSTHRIVMDELTGTLAASLSSLPTPASSQVTHQPPAGERLRLGRQHHGHSGVECMWAGSLGDLHEVVLVGHQDGLLEALRGRPATTVDLPMPTRGQQRGRGRTGWRRPT